MTRLATPSTTDPQSARKDWPQTSAIGRPWPLMSDLREGASLPGPGPSRRRRPELPSGSRPIRVTIPRASALRAVRPRRRHSTRTSISSVPPFQRQTLIHRHRLASSGCRYPRCRVRALPDAFKGRTDRQLDDRSFGVRQDEINAAALSHNARFARRGCTAALDGSHNDPSPSYDPPACHACSRGQPHGSPLALRPRWREVTALRARAARSGTDALRVATPEQETDMDLPTLVAQWSGKLPEGFVQPTIVRRAPAPQCSLERCRRSAAVKKDGTFAHACQRCLDRRAASCRRRRAALVADGGCRRCSYRKRLEGDFLCQRCRDDRDIERAQKRQDAIDAAAIDEFAAHPERVRKASNLDCGVSPGTQDRSRNRQPPTGRRCRTRSRARSASGPPRSAIRDGATAGTDRIATPRRAAFRGCASRTTNPHRKPNYE